MEEKSPPPPARARKPRSKPAGQPAATGSGTRPRRPSRAGRRNPAQTSENEISPPPPDGSDAPPFFDRVVADDGLVRDFDRLASSNPKSAVLAALAAGFAVGFVAAGLLLARD